MEYALLVALVAVATIGSIDFLGRGATERYSSSGSGIGALPSPVAGAPDDDGGGGSATTPPTAAPTTTVAPTLPPTTPAPTVPPTTVPPTTVAPTTTTVKPTTTTVAPTTTTRKAESGGLTVAPPTVVTSGPNWSASTVITARDNNGVPIAGANVNAKIRYLQRDQNGHYQWRDQVVQLRTGADGKVTLSSATYKRNGNDSVTEIQFMVEGVQLPNNLRWDQARTTVTARP